MKRSMQKKEIVNILEKLDIQYGNTSGRIYSKVYDNIKNPTDIIVSSGASKQCLVFKKFDFVVKWCYEVNADLNEALREVTVYEQAAKIGLQQFFPYTEHLITMNGIDFVLQEKIDYSIAGTPNEQLTYYKEHITKTVTRKAIVSIGNKMYIENSPYNRIIDRLWLGMTISLYGKKICDKLCDFIQEYKINDLHEYNLGYKNNKPIILDFSGYNRWCSGYSGYEYSSNSSSEYISDSLSFSWLK